jgi:hypothetical protein
LTICSLKPDELHTIIRSPGGITEKSMIRYVHTDQGGHVLQVQKIACTNAAGFVMYFNPEYIDPNTGQFAESPPDSPSYPIDQTKTIDLSSSSVPVGASVRPKVHADGGDNNPGDTLVQYAQNGQTATYEVQGTTLDYTVKLVG